MTKKYQIGLDEQTLNLVRQASGKDGMGGYVHSLVTQRHEKWTTALTWLQDHGWNTTEIAAVCRLFEQHDLTPEHSLTNQMANTMSAGFEDYAAAAGISAERWQELVEQVRTSEPVAVQLSILVDEFINDNQELAGRLGLHESP